VSVWRTEGPREAERLEAFSDGVMAVIITIMALGLNVPKDTTWHAVADELPSLLVYVLSFTMIGIYWNNHHHLLRATERIGAGVMWANLHLLFWLSLLPVATSWLRASHFSPIPAAAYGVVLLVASISYFILQQTIFLADGPNSTLRDAVGADFKGKLSPLIYVVGIAVAFVQPLFAVGIYALVAVFWLIPDRRIESRFKAQASEGELPNRN
jgi:uncharacterized membrane protein